jgi:hypothetical protein
LPEPALKKNIIERKIGGGSVWRKKRKTEEEKRENRGEEEREEKRKRRGERKRGRGSVCESVLFLLKHINDTEREVRDHKKTFPY